MKQPPQCICVLNSSKYLAEIINVCAVSGAQVFTVELLMFVPLILPVF